MRDAVDDGEPLDAAVVGFDVVTVGESRRGGGTLRRRVAKPTTQRRENAIAEISEIRTVAARIRNVAVDVARAFGAFSRVAVERPRVPRERRRRPPERVLDGVEVRRVPMVVFVAGFVRAPVVVSAIPDPSSATRRIGGDRNEDVAHSPTRRTMKIAVGQPDARARFGETLRAGGVARLRRREVPRVALGVRHVAAREDVRALAVQQRRGKIGREPARDRVRLDVARRPDADVVAETRVAEGPVGVATRRRVSRRVRGRASSLARRRVRRRSPRDGGRVGSVRRRHPTQRTERRFLVGAPATQTTRADRIRGARAGRVRG